MRFDLSDDEWALLEPLMPKARKSARADDRRMNAGRARILHDCWFADCKARRDDNWWD